MFTFETGEGGILCQAGARFAFISREEVEEGAAGGPHAALKPLTRETEACKDRLSRCHRAEQHGGAGGGSAGLQWSLLQGLCERCT